MYEKSRGESKKKKEQKGGYYGEEQKHCPCISMLTTNYCKYLCARLSSIKWF